MFTHKYFQLKNQIYTLDILECLTKQQLGEKPRQAISSTKHTCMYK